MRAAGPSPSYREGRGGYLDVVIPFRRRLNVVESFKTPSGDTPRLVPAPELRTGAIPLHLGDDLLAGLHLPRRVVVLEVPVQFQGFFEAPGTRATAQITSTSLRDTQ